MAAPQQLSSKQYEKELLRLQTELVAKKVKLPARQWRKYKRPPMQSEREVPVRYTVS